MNRRSFLSGILALSAAPAIVRADSLMRIVPRDVLVFHADSFSFVQPEVLGIRELVYEIEPSQSPFVLITREALKVAHEKAKIMNKVDCDTILYGPEVASVLRIRKPNPYKGRMQ